MAGSRGTLKVSSLWQHGVGADCWRDAFFCVCVGSGWCVCIWPPLRGNFACRVCMSPGVQYHPLKIPKRTNPLLHWEEYRFYNSSRLRKKAGDAKFWFYHSFVPVLMSLVRSLTRVGRSRYTFRSHLAQAPWLKAVSAQTPWDWLT